MNPNIYRRAFYLIARADLTLHKPDAMGPCLCSQCEWRRAAAQLLLDAGPRGIFLVADIHRAARRKFFFLLIVLMVLWVVFTLTHSFPWQN